MYLKKSTLRVSFFLLTFIYCVVYMHVCVHVRVCVHARIHVYVLYPHMCLFHDAHVKVR